MKYLVFMFVLVFSTNLFAQAKLPKEVEKRSARIGNMEFGERVWAYPEAMVVDSNGGCWLNPYYIATNDRHGDLEIINSKSKTGYIVRIHYHYNKINGYSVPAFDKWKRGHIPPGFIPVKAVVIDGPIYEKPSPSNLEKYKLSRPYEPKFYPSAPTNPYK